MQGKKILIVEDEWLIAYDLKCILEENAYEVIEIAESGKEAIRMAKEQRPDLVIMDIHLLGNIDGIEAANEIGMLYNYLIPIIYLSNPQSPLIIKYASQSKNKITDFLTKPITPKQLLTTVLFNIGKIPSSSALPIRPSLPLKIVRDFFYVKTKKDEQKRVEVKNVLFIETDGSGTGALVILPDEEYTLDISLTKFLKGFPHKSLVRVHNSYIVNIDHIDKIKTKDRNIHFQKKENVTRKTHTQMRYFKNKNNKDVNVWNGIIKIGQRYRGNIDDILNLPF